jgi:F0F1-type ATP synthase assembly protein I
MVAPRACRVLQRAAVQPRGGGVRGLGVKVAKPKGNDGLSDAAQAERGAAPYLDAVWRMVAALVLGAVAGLFLDRKLGSTPWGVVGGLGLGLGLGFYLLMRSLTRLGKHG